MDHQPKPIVHTSPSFQQSIPVCDRLSRLSAKYPWLVTQNESGEQSLCLVHDKQVRFECRIPEMVGRRIRGCFHGWLILSDKQNVMWSLWNPVTSKFIRLPPMVVKNGNLDDFGHCCLSSDPDGGPSSSISILLLQRLNKPNLVFCRLDGKRKKLRWIEMSYAKQLKSLGALDDDILNFITCSNGKVYALSLGNFFVIHVDIVGRGKKEAVISLSRVWECPLPFILNFESLINPCFMLKGYGTLLFWIVLCFDDEVARGTLVAAYLFKLDTSNATSTWEEIKDLKDAVFFVDLFDDSSVFYNHAITSELGGYIHVRCNVRNRIHSYHVKDRTVSLIFMPPLNDARYVSLLECRLEVSDGEEAKYTIKYTHRNLDNNNNNNNKDETSIIIASIITNDEEAVCNSNGNSNSMMTSESYLVSVPFHILERIMGFCVGIEFLKFRAACKLCHLAAPLMRWRDDEAALKKLRTYSYASPLLMVIEENRGGNIIMNLTDPTFGDVYFINTSSILASYQEIFICCCRYGWLLFYSNLGYLVFFNPLTSDVHKLPTTAHWLENVCFSAPPSSPNCMVVGFTTKGDGHIYILHLNKKAPDEEEPSWHRVDLVAPPYAAFRFPTFVGQNLYALCNEGQLVVFKEISETRVKQLVVAEAPKCSWKFRTRYYLVKRDQHLLLVILGIYGEKLEVFELNHSTKEWEKIDSLGRHTIYVSDTTCSCIETTLPKMQNKIYFPHLHTETRKIVFYSLDKRGYYAFGDDGKIQGTAWEDEMFLGTKYHLNPYAWIEPSWC